MTGPLPLEYFAHWLATGERGLSSEAIVGHLSGVAMGSNHPHDPGDFRRCQRLLAAHPLAAERLGHMRTLSPQWARLVDAWDDIAKAMERAEHGQAPEAYHLIQEAIRPEEANR